MATINNSELTKNIIDGARIQTSYDKVPNQLAEKVVPVMEVNPKLLKSSIVLANITKTSTASDVNILSTGKNDVYLTSIAIANRQNVDCDNVSFYITGKFNGQTLRIFNRTKASVTIDVFHDQITFNPPLKLDRNSELLYTLAFTVGTSFLYMSFCGFIDYNSGD